MIASVRLVRVAVAQPFYRCQFVILPKFLWDCSWANSWPLKNRNTVLFTQLLHPFCRMTEIEIWLKKQPLHYRKCRSISLTTFCLIASNDFLEFTKSVTEFEVIKHPES